MNVLLRAIRRDGFLFGFFASPLDGSFRSGNFGSVVTGQLVRKQRQKVFLRFLSSNAFLLSKCDKMRLKKLFPLPIVPSVPFERAVASENLFEVSKLRTCRSDFFPE